MKADDLLHSVGKVLRAWYVVPLADYCTVQSGKLRYMGQGLFLELPLAVPDFNLSIYDVSKLCDWLITLDDAEVSISANKDKTVTFSAARGWANTVVEINQPKLEWPHTQFYENVDEIVMTPKLVNTYSFTVPAEELERMKKAFAAAGRHEDTATPNVQLTVSSKAIGFSVKSIHGAAKVQFLADSESTSLPESWVGEYLLKAFNFMPFKYPDDESLDVKFSFKDNEKKELSPLMVEYENDVTVVLNPVWH